MGAHPIKRNTHTKGGARNVVYHLSVEEDESFVAGGVVVHNCPICESLGLADPVPLGTPFPTGDYGPPAHPACFSGPTLVTSRQRVTAHGKRRYEDQLAL